MIERLARLGFASKAFIYATVGCLAAAAALNRGGAITDRRGALRALLTQPFGNTVLLVVATGLFGYALWRVLDALLDPDHHGTTISGITVRAAELSRALVYGMLGLEAFRLARGLRASSSDESSRQTRLWAARLMDLPGGELLVALIGLAVVGYGMWEIADAVRNKTDKAVDPGALPAAVRSPLLNIARFGVAARAIVFVALGTFLTRAASQHDPSAARGPRDSIVELVGTFNSRWLLGAIALGFVAYGVDQAVHAWCRRIRAPI